MTSIFVDVFTEIAVLLLVAAVIGAIGVRLRYTPSAFCPPTQIRPR
jgi:hypothetical protein